MARQPRITVLQLDPAAPLGRFDGWLRAGGVRLGTVTLWDRDVPQLASCGDGLLVLGGLMSAHDQQAHPWLDRLADLLADAHSIGLPLLGICLGHQLLAEALGGQVAVGASEYGEEGVVEIDWLPAAASDPVFGALAADGPALFGTTHHDTVVELPAGAHELARSARCPNQVFRVDSAWGVQFHPEADPAHVGSWIPDPQVRDRLVGELSAIDDRIAAGGRQIAAGFANVVRTGG